MQAGGVPVTGDGPWQDPRWSWPEEGYDDAVVELRIHGVGGEGPEGMTRDPHPVRVGGDERVGFWRARNPQIAPGHVREAVSWGGSTSAGRGSALWVLLLPFSLFNAAGRMAPADAGPGRRSLHEAVCRLLALSMTLTVVALVGGIVFDLVALQCGASTLCANADLTGRMLLAPLRWFPGDAAALVAVVALVPVLSAYGLRVVGRRGNVVAGRPVGWDAVELGTRAPERLDAPDMWHNLWPAWRLRGLHITAAYAWVVIQLSMLLPALLPAAPAWLGSLGLLVGVGSVLANALLAALPRTAGTAGSLALGRSVLFVRWVTLLTLGWLVGTGLGRGLDALEPSDPAWVLIWLVGLGAVAWSTRRHVADSRVAVERPAGPSGASRDAGLALGAGLLAALANVGGLERVAVADALAALPPAPAALADLLEGAPAAVHTSTWWLVLAQTVLLGLLAATSLGRRGGAPEGPGGPDPTVDRPGRGPLATAAVPGNLAAPVIAAMSLLLVAAIGGGLHAFLLDWLGARVPEIGLSPLPDAAIGEAARVVSTSPREAVGLALPWWHGFVAVVFLGFLLLLLLAVLTLRFVAARSAASPTVVRRALSRSIAGAPDGPTDVPDAVTEGHERAVDGVVAATTPRWLDQHLLRNAGRALGAVVATSVLVVTVLVGTRLRAGTVTEELWGTTGALALLALVPPAAVLLIRAARDDRLVRRQIGALWDVLAFWPRVTHPFSPPSYAESLVPALVARCNALPSSSPVVLAGHSQGSVLAVAAAVSPLLDEREVHLVTYGSPLAILYEGFFPTVFGGPHGAIARATPPSSPPHDVLPVDGPAQVRPRTWHNVLAISEPFASPLWRHSVGDTPTSTRGDDLGWPVALRLPWHDCPVCGWWREVPDGTDRVAWTISGVRAIDLTITDPDRVVSRAGVVDGRALGHSSYHRSRELDLHLGHLADQIRPAAAPDSDDDLVVLDPEEGPPTPPEAATSLWDGA